MNKSDDDEPVCKFSFKKRERRQNTRKRIAKEEGEESSDDDQSAVKTLERKQRKINPLIQKTSRLAAREGTAQYSSDEEKEDASGSSLQVTFTSTKTLEVEGPRDMGATATYEIDTELDRDARAIFERAQKINEELKGKESDNVYRGLNNYTQYIEKKDTAQGSAAGNMNRKGPIRAPANIRSTVRWDYQPDICKDYKDTGFCGFGDSCKFMHDRSDYKHGWQLEREMEAGTYGVQEDFSKYEVADEGDDLPFKCFICRDSFKHPVVTKCGHYFCERCALDRYKKSKRCFVCNEQTFGIFNPAKDLESKLKRRREEEKDAKKSDDEARD